jgi:hypothetical protein
MKKQSIPAIAMLCTIASCTQSAEHVNTQKNKDSQSTAVIPVPVDSTKQKMPVIIPDTVKQEDMPVVHPQSGIQPK